MQVISSVVMKKMFMFDSNNYEHCMQHIYNEILNFAAFIAQNAKWPQAVGSCGRFQQRWGAGSGGQQGHLFVTSYIQMCFYYYYYFNPCSPVRQTAKIKFVVQGTVVKGKINYLDTQQSFFQKALNNFCKA